MKVFGKFMPFLSNWSRKLSLMYNIAQSIGLQYLMAQTSNCFISDLFQINDFVRMRKLKQQLQNSKKLVFNQELSYSQAKKTINNLADFFRNQNQTKNQQHLEHLDSINNLFKHFKWKIVLSFLLFQIFTLLKIPISLFLLKMLLSIEQNNEKAAFMYLGLLCVMFVLSALVGQSAQFRAQLLTTQMQRWYLKGLLAEILNKKLPRKSQKSEFQLKFFNQIEQVFTTKIKLILRGFSIPLAVLSLSCFLVYIIGWFWLIGVGLIIIVQLVQYGCFGFLNRFLEQALRIREKRELLFTKAALNYKEVFMLNWGKIVHSSLAKFRKQQTSNYLKYSLGGALRLTLNYGLLSVFLLIVQGFNAKYTDNMGAIPINFCILYCFQFVYMTKQFYIAISNYFSMTQTFRQISDYMKQNKEGTLPLNFLSQLKMASWSNIFETQAESDIFIVLKEVNIYPQANCSSQQVIKDINLQIKAGEFLPILVENEKEKDRLLKCLTLQAEVFQGSVEIRRQESLGVVDSFMLKDTLKQNILMGRQLDQQLYEQIISISNLEKENQMFFKSPIDLTSYYDIQSGGLSEKVLATKISMARSLYSQKVVIILDDIFQYLLKQEKKRLINYLKRRSEQKAAVILFFTDFETTHYFHEYYTLENRMLVKIRKLSSRKSQKRQLSNIEDNHRELLSHKMLLEDKKSQQRSSQMQIHSQLQNLKRQVRNCELKFCKTLFHYLSQLKIIAILTLFCHAAAQVILALILTFINDYYLLKSGQLSHLGNYTQFWAYLSLMAFITACLHFLRAILLSYAIQKINTQINQRVTKHLFATRFRKQQLFKNSAEIEQFLSDLGNLDARLFHFLSVFFSVFVLTLVLIIFFSVFNPYLLIFSIALAIPIYFWKNYSHLAIQFSKNSHFKHLKYLSYLFQHFVRNLLQIRVNGYESNLILKSNKAIDQFSRSKQLYVSFNRIFCSYCLYYCVCVVIATFFAITSAFNQIWIYHFIVLALYLMDRITYLASSFGQASVLLMYIQRLSCLQTKFGLHQGKANESKANCGEKKSANMNQLTEVLDYFNKKAAEQIFCLEDSSIQNFQSKDDKGNGIKTFCLTIKKGEKMAIITKSYHQILNLLFRVQQNHRNENHRIQGQDESTGSLQQRVKMFSLIDLNAEFLFQKVKTNIDPFDIYKEQEIKSTLKRVRNRQFQSQLTQQQRQNELQLLFEQNSDSLDFPQKLEVNLCRVMIQKRDIVVIVDQVRQKKDKHPDLFDKALDLLADKAVIMLVADEKSVHATHYSRVYNLSINQNEEQSGATN